MRNSIKPKYKICFRTKSNVWGDNKIKKFKKKKWRHLKKNLFFKMKAPLFNYKKKENYKFLYKNKLLTKLVFRLVYGKLKDFQIKRKAKKVKNIKNIFKESSFIGNFELKLSNILVRVLLCKNIISAKKYIKSGSFLLNGFPVFKNELVLKPGDFLQVNKNFWKKIFYGTKIRLKKKVSLKKKYTKKQFQLKRQFSISLMLSKNKKLFERKRIGYSLGLSKYPRNISMRLNFIDFPYLEINYNTLSFLIKNGPKFNEVIYSSHFMNLNFIKLSYF